MDDPHPVKADTRRATIALLIATVFWGSGFTLAKTAGEAINRAVLGAEHGAVGPVWILAMRFGVAGVLWLIVFRESRRAWTWDLVRRSAILGGWLSVGMIVQHIGLDRTSEAVSAFLTSLTILFVPLMMTLVLRRPPPPAVWVGVVVAGVGVWVMTGASPSGFGMGELLGLACAVAYSVDIIAVGMLATPQNAVRITAGQFLVVAAITTLVCLILPGGRESLTPHRVIEFMSSRQIGLNVLLLAVLVTMGAFGLQFQFQPRLDPTRAALLYLMEPIFASLYAYLARGSRMSGLAIAGAGLILAANLLVELWQSRGTREAKADAGMGAAVID
jgi:drug/metabolite transporter (DMT)-like permease